MRPPVEASETDVGATASMCDSKSHVACAHAPADGASGGDKRPTCASAAPCVERWHAALSEIVDSELASLQDPRRGHRSSAQATPMAECVGASGNAQRRCANGDRRIRLSFGPRVAAAVPVYDRTGGSGREPLTSAYR